MALGLQDLGSRVKSVGAEYGCGVESIPTPYTQNPKLGFECQRTFAF